MSDETIVAVYDTAAHADAAIRDLKAANVPDEAISQHAGTQHAGIAASAPAREPGFWGSLFGGEAEHDTTVYDRSLESGSTVVSVRVSADHYDRVSKILEAHHPVDLDERSAQYGLAQTSTTRTMAAPGGALPGTKQESGTIRLAEESLSVGKRAVSGGTTRVRRYVVETPVEEHISLRSEKVTLERRPVTDGKIVGTADFSDKTIEMTESHEEAVVSKSARVVEEVVLRKDATERVETVKDTLRRDAVEIEQAAGAVGQKPLAGTTTGAIVPPAPSATPKI